MTLNLTQTPEPGTYIIFSEGDFLNIELKLPENTKGQAYLRTNLYQPHKKKTEIIRRAEENIPRLYQDWGDFPLQRKDNQTFIIELPLTTPGFFEAKTFFLEEGAHEPIWPEGDNLFIKVEPAGSFTGNSIYSAFVRLFLEEDKINSIKNHPARQESTTDIFHIIPETGKFSHLIDKLDFIIDEMGFDIIMLLPVHPVPTTYARMGMLGSPYAALDFFSVDPGLAEFDKETTPLQQFTELIEAIHGRHARIFMDIPANHTGWASQLQIHHPEYFVQDHNGEFISPGAWGVTWSDLSELDYSHKELWKYMADVFLFWCNKGVDGFRCDAGYMIPVDAWKYIIARVRNEFPQTIFLLEGLGGKIKVTEELLTESNMNWAYSEMFQNYSQQQLDHYIDEFNRISFAKGPLVNFSETHDNNRLASISPEFSRLRNGLTALLSHKGTFAVTCGVEWFANEKINVHKLTSLNWGASNNQVEFIKKLNYILKTNPACKSDRPVKKIHTSNLNSVAYLRESHDGKNKLAIIANLSDRNNEVFIKREPGEQFIRYNNDILTANTIDIINEGEALKIALTPYQIIALSNSAENTSVADNQKQLQTTSTKQGKNLKNQLIKLFISQNKDITESFIDQKVKELLSSPYNFFFNNFDKRPPVIKWRYPQDIHREVVIPEGMPVLIHIPYHFRYKLQQGKTNIITGEGIRIREHSFIAILIPELFKAKQNSLKLLLEIFENGKTKKYTSYFAVVSYEKDFKLIKEFYSPKIENDKLLSSLAVNKFNSISLLRGAFATLQSKYDALLSVNPNPELPDDRHIMLTRFRGWTVFKGFSREISIEYQNSFEHFQNTSEYYFKIPGGSGLSIPLTLTFKLDEEENIIQMIIKRLSNVDVPTPPSDEPVKIILRPDIESRSHHEITKAYMGPEKQWPQQIQDSSGGFVFYSDDKILEIKSSMGNFTRQDEWQYMVHRNLENERGMDGNSDLFSPGYFTFYLKNNERAAIYAYAGKKNTLDSLHPIKKPLKSDISSLPEIYDFRKTMQKSIQKFIVARNSNKTVIAGYPWFLDWGRDTLICLRGIVAAGFHRESLDIIKEFASLEDKGTIPNTLRGKDTSNRDTSDAPLWLFRAVEDFMQVKTKEILNEDCSGRPLKKVLKSIGNHYIEGTPNGIRMDEESGLIYSPPHFTWMDTNYPAGTPRQGYPVEIQALWYNAVKMLSGIFPEEKHWKGLAEKTKQSITTYYVIEKVSEDIFSPEIYLSDCIHTGKFQPVSEGKKDDHLRPNQLFAITLGAIDNPEICSGVLSQCEELLVPGAIRTLADRPTEFELPVYHKNRLLNNPSYPYYGRYTGDEDTSRKPAYHNGTAWTWVFPSYCEAMVKIFGVNALNQAKDKMASAIRLFNKGCIHQLPEITDGNYPHTQKGCFAQAWGLTEFFRVGDILGMF